MENKQLEDIDTGSIIDVRDTNYIWCEAEVKLIIEQIGKPATYSISYKGWSSQWDEIISSDTPRVAKRGTLTTRPGIPCYQNIYRQTYKKMVNTLHNQIIHDPFQVLKERRLLNNLDHDKLPALKQDKQEKSCDGHNSDDNQIISPPEGDSPDDQQETN